MSWEVFVALLWCHHLEIGEFIVQEGMVGILEDDCWLLLQLIEGKPWNILPHYFSCSGFGTPLGNFTIDSRTSVGKSTFSRAHVLFKVLLEDLIFLILRSLLDFVLDWLWDEVGYFESFCFLGGLLVATDEGSLEILWSFCLYFF